MTTKARSLTASRKQEELADVEAKTTEITNWIEDILKEKLTKKDLRENLVDGVILCKLMNAVKPNCIKRYHRRPKMTMMKMENIAFFLAACKSRCGVPPALLFAPTDLQDGDFLTSMRKVLNVLLLLKQEAGGGPSAEEAAKQLAEKEERREKELAAEAEEAQKRGEDVYTEAVKSYDPTEEPELPEDDDDEPEPEPESTPTPAPVKHTEKSSPASTASSSSSDASSNWYIHGKTSEYVDVQKEILSEITTAIHSELSVEGKRKLAELLKSHIKNLEKRIMSAQNAELKTLAHEMGLGNSVSDIPDTKDRQWYLDYIMKYGRISK